MFELSFSIFKVFHLYFFLNIEGCFLNFPLFPWANYLVIVALITVVLCYCCNTVVSWLSIIPYCYFWQNLRIGTILITFLLILTFKWYQFLAEGQCDYQKTVGWGNHSFYFGLQFQMSSAIFFALGYSSSRFLTFQILVWLKVDPFKSHKSLCLDDWMSNKGIYSHA